MGAMIAQAVGGLLVSRLVSKWGSSQKSVPQVTTRASDLVQSTEADKPQGMQVGGDDPTKAKRGRKALTIQQDNTQSNQGYNPMNM